MQCSLGLTLTLTLALKLKLKLTLTRQTPTGRASLLSRLPERQRDPHRTIHLPYHPHPRHVAPHQMLGKEPVCDKIFDFDFEKSGGRDGDLGGGGVSLVPKKQRVIPGSELKALVLE